MSNFVVGLTGGIGSGKTTVANMFADLGIALIDADLVARDVVAPNSYALNEIEVKFGSDFILPTGYLDRAKLRQQVFSNDNDKQWLNTLLHPLIRQSIIDQLNSNTDLYCILVAPLLIENNLVKHVNRTLVIDIDEKTQLLRTLKRDNNNTANITANNNHRATIKNIIKSQVSRSKRLQAADDIIDNSSTDLQIIKTQVNQLHQLYLKLANKI